MDGNYYVWVWVDKDGVPYYLGKAKNGSSGHNRNRKNNYPPRPPIDQRRILSWHEDEEGALRELERLENKYMNAISSPGLGTLLNPLNVNLKQLNREDRDHGKNCTRSVPVTAYSLNGEVLGNYHSLGDASRELGISRTQISRMCCGWQYHANGICVRRQDDQFEPDLRIHRINKRVIGIDEREERKVFESMAEAAGHVVGKRDRGSDIKRSLHSPVKNKHKCLGWTFFYEGEEPSTMSTVKYAKRGRRTHV